MKKYYVKNGKVVVNKYCVQYVYNVDNGNSETKSEVVQYAVNDNELNALTKELEAKGQNVHFAEVLKHILQKHLKYRCMWDKNPDDLVLPKLK